MPGQVVDHVKEWPKEAAETAKEVRTVERHLRRHYKRALKTANVKRILVNIVASAPLITALIAPLSSMYDIPALAQHWFVNERGESLPDPPGCLALSSIGLAFNIVGNATLILRFSIRKTRWWNTALFSSTMCWVIKSILAITNLAVYGPSSVRDIGQHYSEGWWCAVYTCVLANVIAVMLVSYAIYAKMSDIRDNQATRVQARHFLLSQLSFFLWLAIEALAISRLEGWTYYTSLYFAIVTALTVGFGSDFAPTTTAARILMFPFSLITIAGLATQVSSIIDFFDERTKKRKKRWRALYEKREGDEYRKAHPTGELLDEMRYLQRISDEEDRISRAYDLTLSLCAFILFWILGALVFHRLEGWSYGIGLYFCYVFFFTIGYGDFYPTTASGRVFFVTYALIAVPIVASFAMQAVSQVMMARNQKRLEKSKERIGLSPKVDRTTSIKIENSSTEDGNSQINPFISHAELVIASHQRYRKVHGGSSAVSPAQDMPDVTNIDSADRSSVSRITDEVDSCDDILRTESERLAQFGDGLREGGGSSVLQALREEQAHSEGQAHSYSSSESVDVVPPANANEEQGSEDAVPRDKDTSIPAQREMLDEVLLYAMILEEQARKLILANLKSGSKARLLLHADQIVMQRSTSLLVDTDPTAQKEVLSHSSDGDGDETDELHGIHLYREAFANLLVAGTRCRDLQGLEQLRWERRQGYPFKDGVPVATNCDDA